jgi:hypothetical protein
MLLVVRTMFRSRFAGARKKVSALSRRTNLTRAEILWWLRDERQRNFWGDKDLLLIEAHRGLSLPPQISLRTAAT